MDNPKVLYSEEIPMLKRRIGLPLNVNSRSEFGILLSSTENANHLHSNKDILTFGKTARQSSVGQLMQTKNPLRWKLSSLKRNKQKKNDSLLDGTTKSSCCKSKASKRNAQSGNMKPTKSPQQGKSRFFLYEDNANNSLGNTKLNALHPMYPYINGKCISVFMLCN